MPVRIGAVSPMDNAMEAIGEAFGELWPEAGLFHLLDESLYLDFAGASPSRRDRDPAFSLAPLCR